ncbi:MAG: GNAT family N-acetyltransferase [Pseudobdellovibrionaceae bacterium]
MLSGPINPSPTEYDRVIQFLNQTLRPNLPWSISEEYPNALLPNNIHNITILKDGNDVVSHAVLKPLVVKSPHVIFKVGTIGSVVTKEDHRNQGHSQKIIQNCLDLAREQSCDVAILWTNLYEFYQKMGFELSGYEISMVFEKEFTSPVKKLYRFSEEKNVSPEALLRLYSLHSVNSLRTVDDMRKFLAIPKTKLYTAWNTEHQLLAYAVEGKGIDLDSYIHEWGGGVSDLVSLLSHIRTVKKTPMTLIAPKHAQNLIQQLKPYSQVSNEGFLGMMKIINFDQLSAKIKRAMRAEGYSQIVLEKHPQHYLLGYGENLITLDHEADLIRLLFGPLNVGDLETLTPETKQIFSKIFPLPLWIWGWDSI